MDGKNLLRRLREVLDEESTGTWMDDRTSYDFLWEAAKQFVFRTGCITSETEFLTVANQKEYQLPTNFIKLYLKNRDNRFYVQYSGSGADNNIFFRDLEDLDYNKNAHTYDTQQSTMTRTSTTFKDIGQDFSDWETTSGNAAYKITVTHTTGAVEWAYLDEASTGTNTDDTIAVYSDLALSSTGWNGTSGTPSFYRIENTSGQTTPDFFTVRDKQDKMTQSTGTATSAGGATAGSCTLTDTSATFITTEYVTAGDLVHNTTDGSDGVVLSITSDTALVCALFGGTDNDWTSSDAYVIQPQSRQELYFDPPPSESGYIVRVPFLARPAPVYSDYGVYEFRTHNMEAIIKYAGWLYKYRDSEPDFGDKLYMFWDNAIRQEAQSLRPHVRKRKLNVNLKKRQ